LSQLMDFVAPVTPVAEKAGSFINVDGLMQSFEAALNPWGESRPEWEILVNLAREIPVNYRYFGRFNSPRAIWKAIAEEKLNISERL